MSTSTDQIFSRWELLQTNPGNDHYHVDKIGCLKYFRGPLEIARILPTDRKKNRQINVQLVRCRWFWTAVLMDISQKHKLHWWFHVITWLDIAEMRRKKHKIYMREYSQASERWSKRKSKWNARAQTLMNLITIDPHNRNV